MTNANPEILKLLNEKNVEQIHTLHEHENDEIIKIFFVYDTFKNNMPRKSTKKPLTIDSYIKPLVVNKQEIEKICIAVAKFSLHHTH